METAETGLPEVAAELPQLLAEQWGNLWLILLPVLRSCPRILEARCRLGQSRAEQSWRCGRGGSNTGDVNRCGSCWAADSCRLDEVRNGWVVVDLWGQEHVPPPPWRLRNFGHDFFDFFGLFVSCRQGRVHNLLLQRSGFRHGLGFLGQGQFLETLKWSLNDSKCGGL